MAPFTELIHVFRNHNGEEMQAAFSRGHIHFQTTGGVSQIGCWSGSGNAIRIRTSSGEVVAHASPSGTDFPPHNSIPGHWRKLDLRKDFLALKASELQGSESQEPVQDTEEVKLQGISQCRIRIGGAKMEGTPPLRASTFEEVFRHMKAEMPETLRQNLIQSGTWGRQPTLLEKYVITAGLALRDLLCICPVGSGPTRAFLLPMLSIMTSKLGESRAGVRGQCFPDTVIICPTRERAAECHQVASSILRNSGFRCVCLHQQKTTTEQLTDLALGVDLLVATPACLSIMVTQRIVRLDYSYGLVVVDASSMVDMGMRDFCHSLMQCGMPSEANRMSMMFMNSMVNPEVLALSKEVLHQPVTVQVVPSSGRSYPLQLLHVEDREKTNHLERDLQNWLSERQGRARILVWVHSRTRAQFLDDFFYRQRLPCAALHTEVEPLQKARIWRKFCEGETKVIFTTDAGCNGMDISAVDVLLHYDLPCAANVLSLRLNRQRTWCAKVFMYVDPDQELAEVLSSLSQVLAEDGAEVPSWLADAQKKQRDMQDGRAAWGNWNPVDHGNPDHWQEPQEWTRDSWGWTDQNWQRDAQWQNPSEDWWNDRDRNRQVWNSSDRDGWNNRWQRASAFQ